MNELGPDAREIMDAGRAGDEPTAEDRTRVRASILRAIAAGGVIGVASTAAETSAAAGLKMGAVATWKLVAGLLLAGAVAGTGAGLAVSRSHEEAPPRSPAAVAAVTALPALPPAGPTPEAAASGTPAVSPPVAAPPRTAPQPGPIAASPRAGATPLASAAPAAPQAKPEDTLAEENQGLRDAHAAMQGGDPARALALLDEQQAKGSALREEREAARVLALCQLGRVDEGRAAAARFQKESPRSPLADRVRGACPSRATP
jgi:hypothetical protein